MLFQQFPGIDQVFLGIAGLVLQQNLVGVYTVFLQIVRHAGGLGGGLIAPLSSGHYHSYIRVVVQIVQSGVQPILEQNRRLAPGHHPAAQNDHHLGVSPDHVVGPHHHQPKHDGKEKGPYQHQG